MQRPLKMHAGEKETDGMVLEWMDQQKVLFAPHRKSRITNLVG